MPQQDYHDAVVEAAKEAIESGSRLLAVDLGLAIEKPQGSSTQCMRTVASRLREAERRGLVNH